MLRRILIFGACLSLLGLGPAVLSLCAMRAGLPSECSPKVTVSTDCAQMAAHHPDANLAPADSATCCTVKAAPSPDAVTVAKQVPSVPSQVQAEAAESVLPPQAQTETAHPADTSPPADSHQRQSLLCVFLI